VNRGRNSETETQRYKKKRKERLDRNIEKPEK
jgi:hypothetical protein